MSKTGITRNRVSSSASTGSAGTFFEQHVDAYWLAQLLVRGIPPILRDCGVVEVHLQTEHHGWNADDFLVVGENGTGTRRKLVGQVKRTFTVSATDEECQKAMQDFWKDFKKGSLFAPEADRFALVTLRGTTTLLENFAGLLDCARASRDGVEFEGRLNTPGFLNAKAVHYCGEIQTIVGLVESKSVSVVEIWPFLCVLHVLPLDLNTATAQTEVAIKSMLAYTANEQDALGASESSWNSLLELAGKGMPEARRFHRNDLPEPLRQRHLSVGGNEDHILGLLRQHSELIIKGIRSTIGDTLHLARGRLVQQLLEQLESIQVVLVTGAAGSGKSGIAKDAFSVLATDHFAFSFRAEEFASAHLDETLQRNQIPANAAILGAVLAAQGRKVLLVESVERLLEASTRDAFTDLLTLVASDQSWRLILTCRDYSTDLVRACFLESARVGHSVVTVTSLDDEELQEVTAAFPTLVPPLTNPALRRLLRNPYVLDKALQIRWSDERPLPQSEREFRTLFWQEIVRAAHRSAGGMPHRREQVFVQVALRRARALTLFATCSDLDPEVVDGLRHDSLIVSSEQRNLLLAPAHDVLEDWAILQWIDDQHATHEGSFRELSAAVGTYPAIRRTYRKWVSELVERDQGAADALFQAAVTDAGVPVQFRDDTLVSLLRSSNSAGLLERHRETLFANNKELLRRVIHLLRVACVTTPAWLRTSAGNSSLFNVPDGPAWACVLRLVQSHLDSFTEADWALLLGFIEDWARGVSWQCPYPEGAESVAVIAHWLLPAFDDYRTDDQRKRTVSVIAKIPNADRERFASLLRGDSEDEERDRAAEDLREIVYEGMESMPSCRDLPELVISVAREHFLCSEDELRDRLNYGDWLETEPLFGIKRSSHHDYFPPSAYRGPFLQLLRHHARDGLDFIISLFNHSTDWYARPRVRFDSAELPSEMMLTFSDGNSRTQWCNACLWNLYRGTSNGPHLLQTALMALELWLFEVADAMPRVLDATLLQLLQRSDSAAITAVAASLATAFPQAACETLLVLLRSRHCILLDRHRLVHESQAPSRLSGLMPQLNAMNKIYDQERTQADLRPHRRHDLETAIANLQLGSNASRVHDLLDQHRAEMPPIEEQDEYDRIWRLALHRMDLRQYTVNEDTVETSSASDGGRPPEEGQRYIRLDLKSPDPDVKEMADQAAANYQAMNDRLGLLMWGLKVFGHEERTTYDPARWRLRLQEARRDVDADGTREGNSLGRGGPGIVAAVCIRDHWEEMPSDEQEWCVNEICSEVERDGDNWNQLARIQLGGMEGDRASAWVLPLLIREPLSAASASRVRQTLVIALTHAINEVRSCAAAGIGEHLWEIDREFTLRCVNALATETRLLQAAVEEERNRLQEAGDFTKLYSGHWRDRVEANIASVVRRRFFEADGISSNAYQNLDSTHWYGAETNKRILAILGKAPTESAATAAFEQLAHTLVGWWDADNDRRRERRERNFETEQVLTQLLENFLLRTSAATVILQPILNAVERHPREVTSILEGLIGVEDRQPNTPQFWALWSLFADKVRGATWLARIDAEHSSGSEMLSAIFLGSWWKDEVRHWRSLEGHAEHIHTLFQELPASSTVLDDYVRFLYHVGEQSLPNAFISIVNRLLQGEPQQMLRKGNTVFMLEVLLQRYVYGRPLELKRQTDLRNAVLTLLDVLVENGSSASFRMRDDFLTPLPIQ